VLFYRVMEVYANTQRARIPRALRPLCQQFEARALQVCPEPPPLRTEKRGGLVLFPRYNPAAGSQNAFQQIMLAYQENTPNDYRKAHDMLKALYQSNAALFTTVADCHHNIGVEAAFSRSAKGQLEIMLPRSGISEEKSQKVIEGVVNKALASGGAGTWVAYWKEQTGAVSLSNENFFLDKCWIVPTVEEQHEPLPVA